jgi:hypothetical protein
MRAKTQDQALRSDDSKNAEPETQCFLAPHNIALSKRTRSYGDWASAHARYQQNGEICDFRKLKPPCRGRKLANASWR